jgi:hypothetical protein
VPIFERTSCTIVREVPREMALCKKVCARFPEESPFSKNFCAQGSIYKAPSDLIDSNSREKGISREPRAQSRLRGSLFREPHAQRFLQEGPSEGTSRTKVFGRGPVVKSIVREVP